MQCEQAQAEISALVDGELSGERHGAAEAHLATCVSCSALAEDYRRIGRSLKAVAYRRAPAELAERIRLQIEREEGRRPLSSSGWKHYASQAAALLLVAGLSALASWQVATTRGVHDSLQGDILTAHVRSLLQESPTQVTSSDQHTVKPWFVGRLDFSPPVQDLTAEGFPLTGARLDFIGDRRVASMVYKRRQHVINLFVWPADGTAAAQLESTSSKGYNTLAWTANGVVYRAISDLNLAEFKQFQSLLARR
jgi:anti-sigma factor RsiW